MNVEVYLFGDLGSGYTQYIDDNSRILFKSIVSKSKANSQLVIHRDDTLMFYTYVRRLHNAESSNNRYIGISYVLNNHFINDIDGLFNIFEGAITTIVSRGILLEYSNSGNILATIGKIYNAKSEFAHISAYLKNELDVFMAGKNDTLPPLDYSINDSESRTFTFADSRSEIIKALSTFPTIYIFKDAEYENKESKSYASILFRQNKEIKQLKDTIIQRDKTISNHEKQRNNYRLVLCLLSFIFVGTIIFYFFAQSKSKIIDDQTDKIETLNSDVQSKNTRIQNLKQNVLSLEKELENANTTIINLMVTNELVTDSLRQTEEKLRDSEILIEEKNNNIADLKTKLPQKYKTKYEEQYLYINCANKFTKGTCYFPDKGTTITVYLKKDGYGLTHIGGWIPMSSLEEY